MNISAYIKLIVENHIMLQRNIYPTIASRLGVRLEEAHIRFSTYYSIEKIIAILREILDNNGVKYDEDVVESSAVLENNNITINSKQLYQLKS